VDGVLFAPPAVLLQLDLSLDELLILRAPVVNSTTIFTREFDESVLRHDDLIKVLKRYYTQFVSRGQIPSFSD
jgi:hypothetical protein